jgi:hypothetical protein
MVFLFDQGREGRLCRLHDLRMFGDIFLVHTDEEVLLATPCLQEFVLDGTGKIMTFGLAFDFGEVLTSDVVADVIGRTDECETEDDQHGKRAKLVRNPQ